MSINEFEIWGAGIVHWRSRNGWHDTITHDISDYPNNIFVEDGLGREDDRRSHLFKAGIFQSQNTSIVAASQLKTHQLICYY